MRQIFFLVTPLLFHRPFFYFFFRKPVFTKDPVQYFSVFAIHLHFHFFVGQFCSHVHSKNLVPCPAMKSHVINNGSVQVKKESLRFWYHNSLERMSGSTQF